MRDMIRPLRLEAALTRYMTVVLAEARELFRRRKLTYALLAVTFSAGAVYVASTAYPMVTENGTPSASSSDGSSSGSHDSTNNDNQEASPNDSAGSGSSQSSSISSNVYSDSTSSHSTVIVNGRNIAVPENGSTHTTVPGDSGGGASVDITHSSSASGNSSTLNVHVESSSGDTPSD